MTNLSDQQLLSCYCQERSEDAFAELVHRHIDVVYSSALRMVRDPHLAEDVTQTVFVALAGQARKLTDRPVLSGWLHRTSQNIAVKAIRSDVRRRAREEEAVAMNELHSTDSDAVWEQIAPHLDYALGQLTEADRDALLLRYFHRRSAREMAETLGTSEDAAQKRVSRAIERIRHCFLQKGITVGAGGLALVLSSHAVHAAPVGLTAAITSATSSAAFTASTSSLVKWLTAKTVAALIGSAVIVGTGAVLLQSQVLPKNQKATAPSSLPAAANIAGKGLVSGILKTSDGQPLANAEVYLSTGFVPVPVYAERSEKVQSTVSGSDGRFAFPEDPANRAVIVLHEKGYAQATVSDLAANPDLLLQPWAHIEGTLRLGSKPMANQTIQLSRTRFGSKIQERKFRTVHDTTVTTDVDGRYVFDRVAPGDTWICWRKDKNGYGVQYRYVDVQPGQSLTVDIGGRGRPVTGRAVLLDAENSGPAKFYGSVWPHTLHQMPKLPNWSELSPEEQENHTAAWEKTPDAKIYNQERCPIDFRFAADGTFTIPDLPAGGYRVVVASWTGAPMTSRMISRGVAQIVVPDMPGERSDQPLDIGTVEAFYAKPLREGDPAPLFEAKTLAGLPFKLSDCKGCFVLLNFWRSNHDLSLEDVPQLKAAHDIWGKDKRLVIVGLNFDDRIEMAKNMVDQQKLNWTQCFPGGDSKLPMRYRLRAPTTMLIGPDLRILHPDLHGSEITNAVHEALALALK